MKCFCIIPAYQIKICQWFRIVHILLWQYSNSSVFYRKIYCLFIQLKKNPNISGRKDHRATRTTWHQTGPAYCGCPHAGVCQSAWAFGQQSFRPLKHTHTWMLTLGVGKEDEAPDAGHRAHEQAGSKQHTLLQHTAQPANKEEPTNHLHTTQSVHHTVSQLSKPKVLLRQWCYHGLERFCYYYSVYNFYVYYVNTLKYQDSFAAWWWWCVIF